MVQMPAMNTPQFSGVKSRLPNEPQPVPPIYQPEVGAKAVLFAARSRRREIYVGRSTITAILGDKLAPGFADRYLARHGYEEQQTEQPVDPKRRDNLWTPAPEDRGAHGPFSWRRPSPSQASRDAVAHAQQRIRRGLGLVGAGFAYHHKIGGGFRHRQGYDGPVARDRGS